MLKLQVTTKFKKDYKRVKKIPLKRHDVFVDGGFAVKSYVDKPEALLEYVVSEPMLKAGALDAMRQDEKDFTYRVVPPESVMATRGRLSEN